MRDSEELLRLIYGAIVNADIDVDAVDEALEFSCEQMGDPSRRSRHRWQINFWSQLERVTADPDIGIHLCPHLPPFRGQILEYLFLSSPTFGKGCYLAMHYVRLVSDAFHAGLIERGGWGVIELTGTNGESSVLRHSEVCFVFGVIGFMQRMTRDAFKPESVRLCCAPGTSGVDYPRIFGCPVEFGQGPSEIRFDAKLLDLPSSFDAPGMLDLHIEHANRQLADLRRQDLLDDIHDAVIERLAGGDTSEISLTEIADSLSQNARTLRRELATMGCSFRQLVKSARFGIARRLLRLSNAAVGDIALFSGFSDSAPFYRAFKAWAGVTPSRYREMHRVPEEHRLPEAVVLRHMMHIDS